VSILPIQTGALLPTKPAGLGAAVTVIGLTIMMGSYVRITLQEMDSQSREAFDVEMKNRRLAGMSFAGGILFITIGSLQRYQLVVHYMGILFFVGSLITGVSHVRFWKKVELLLRKQECSGNLARTIKYGIISLFVIIIVGSILFELVVSNPFGATFVSQLAFAYTLLVLGLSIVGLSKRVLPLREQVDNKLVYGFILTIAGTQIFDLSLTNALLFMIIGTVGYTAGFWFAVYYWLYR
jgi:hypothetical protein